MDIFDKKELKHLISNKNENELFTYKGRKSLLKAFDEIFVILSTMNFYVNSYSRIIVIYVLLL